MTTRVEVQAKNLINSIPHSKFSVTKGLSCRLSMNTAFGCETSCSYCYIRYMARWKGIQPNEMFSNIKIRTNAPSLLAKEIRNKKREWMWIGSTTDPYQDFEEEFKLMPDILDVLESRKFPYEIITKSPLVARDAKLLGKSSEYGFVSMSIFSSLNDKKRRSIELKAKPVQDRIDALKTLNQAGVRTMALLLPILPEYSDDIDEIRGVLRAIRSAGTTRLYAGVMRLYPITWSGMKQMMSKSIHKLREKYEEIYFGPSHTKSSGARVPDINYRWNLMKNISRVAKEEGFAQFSCEENFFNLWFGPQNEHAGFRYAIHYDFWLERSKHGGRPLSLQEALAVSKNFYHTPSFLKSVQENLEVLNKITDPVNIPAAQLLRE